MRNTIKNISFVLAACLFAPGAGHAQNSSMRMTPGTVKNFQLPNFDKKSGYKEWEIFGSKADYKSDEQIFVSDMRMELFDGKENLTKTAEFSSASAEFSAIETRAKSSDTLFVDGEGFKLQGDDWLWSGSKRFVNLSKNVNVEFVAEHEGKQEKMLIKSEKAAMDYSSDIDKFVFENSVKVFGDGFTIECNELKTESPKSGGKNLESLKEITASKDVKITQEKIVATAQTARLLPSSGDLSLEGSPMVIDISSKASVSGDMIEFDKAKSTALARSSKNGKTRAKAIIVSEKNGKHQTNIISADTIEMQALGERNVFSFKGNVHVVSEDFEAFGDKIRAETKKDASQKNSSISKITGEGSIRFVSQGRTAKSDEIEIYPQAGEVWLKKRANLEDKSRGISLDADRIVLLRDIDRAVASSDGDSFVTLNIMQSENFGLSQRKDARKTRIQSRSLKMDKKDDEILLSFMRDVAISSEDINAKCSFMDVYAEAESIDGRTSIKRIEAFEDVVVNQKGAQAKAQIAKIFPRVDIDVSNTQKESHRYMQLLTSPDHPTKRPVMILPSIDNVGLGEVSSSAAKTNTVIVSDNQKFVSGPEKDTYIFEGNVHITGTDFTAESKTVEVEIKADKSGKRSITLVVLKGNVNVIQGKRSAAAGRADIYPAQEKIDLTESPVVVSEDGTQAHGTKIIYTKGKSSLSLENPLIRLPEIGKTNKK